MKQTDAYGLVIVDVNFISHYVQMKPTLEVKSVRGGQLYIPLRSDETRNDERAVAVRISFISHYVQMKHAGRQKRLSDRDIFIYPTTFR